jgi:hypothetical protein
MATPVIHMNPSPSGFYQTLLKFLHPNCSTSSVFLFIYFFVPFQTQFLFPPLLYLLTYFASISRIPYVSPAFKAVHNSPVGNMLLFISTLQMRK